MRRRHGGRKCQRKTSLRKLKAIGGANAIAHSVKWETTDIAPIPGVEGPKPMTKRKNRALSRASAFSCVAAFAPIGEIEI